MCPRNDANFQEAEMPFDTFTRIVDDMPFLKGVQICGLGEPFLHRDLFKMIRYVRQRDMTALVVTNGTLLNRANTEAIFRSDITTIHISIDSADPETYATIRVGAKLEEVKRNIKHLTEEKTKRRSALRVIINSVLMRRNFRQIALMVKLGYETGADLVNFSDIGYGFDVGISKRDESLRLLGTEEKREAEQHFNHAKTFSQSLGVPISLPRLEQPNRRQQCEQPFTYFTINEQMNVRPCCGIHKRHFGDLAKQTWREIWNNKEFQAFRGQLLSDDIPAECRDCGML